MTRSADILLREIKEAIRLVEVYVGGVEFEGFSNDTEKQDAVIRRLEIIGEAVKNLPGSIRDQYPAVPWREIAGARDLLIHEYFRVDLALAWQMVKDDLPRLAADIDRILGETG
jgi:uncharacterized protein with HEPN domain